MTKRKKQSIYELQDKQYWQTYEWARLLSEQYPHVAAVKIDITFKDLDWATNPAPRSLVYRPQQKAHFRMKCPYRECVWGGFDFSSYVEEAIRSSSNEAAGQILCNGWQDQERINKHQCMLESAFTVTIERRTPQ
jgi:hypothetical protein